MKIFAIIILLIVPFNATGCALVQQKNSSEQKSVIKPDDSKQLPAELSMLISNARSVPAEFAVDSLITIVESEKITNQEESRRILEEAFQLASGTQQPVKREAMPGSLVDTRSGYLSLAFARKLDTLSLQSRAVKAMLALDKQEARQLFVAIPKPKLPPLSCTDALSYDVSEFYSTLSNIARASFSKEEKRLDEHIRFVQSYLEDMRSPVQVEPMAKVILSLNPSPAQLTLLVHSFSNTLEKISDDDRSFSFSIENFGGRGITQLVGACKRQGVSRNELLQASRAYFVRHLSASRCADNVNPSQQNFSDPGFIAYFNKLLLEVDPSNKHLPPITPDDTKPLKIEESAKVYPYWESVESKKLLFDIKKLKFGSGIKPLTAIDMATPDWQSKLGEFLNNLANWDTGTEKSQEDYFHQKSILYEGLYKLVPAGPERDNVLSSYAAFLRQPTIQQSSRIEWFLHANALVNIAHSSKGDERSKILEILSREDTVLQVYADIEKLLPIVKTQNRMSP